MTSKKSGEPAVPRAVWKALCSAYKEIADDLLAASERALEPHMTAADIAVKLTQRSSEYLERAITCANLANKTRRGRPSSRPASANPLAERYKAKIGPGRPATRGKDFDRATYRIVEDRRRALAADHKKATIVAAITSLVEELATRMGSNRANAMKAEFNRLRASYRSGKQLS